MRCCTRRVGPDELGLLQPVPCPCSSKTNPLVISALETGASATGVDAQKLPRSETEKCRSDTRINIHLLQGPFGQHRPAPKTNRNRAWYGLVSAYSPSLVAWYRPATRRAAACGFCPQGGERARSPKRQQVIHAIWSKRSSNPGV
jgi:hypothetical protein